MSFAYSAVAATQLDIQFEMAETAVNADSFLRIPLLCSATCELGSSPNHSAGMVTAVAGMGMMQVRGVSVTDAKFTSPTLRGVRRCGRTSIRAAPSSSSAFLLRRSLSCDAPGSRCSSYGPLSRIDWRGSFENAVVSALPMTSR